MYVYSSYLISRANARKPSFTPIIICRFILNLRQVKPLAESSEVSDNQFTSVRFVGNAGEPLRSGVESEFDEEYTVHVEEPSTSIHAHKRIDSHTNP